MRSTGLKKCMPTTRSRREAELSDFVDRERRGIAGENGRRRQAARELGEELLLHGEVFDDRFDDEIAAFEACIDERRLQQGHAAALPVRGESPAPDLLVEERGSVGQCGGDRSRLDVLEAHGQVGLVGDEVGDPPAHDSGAEDSRMADTAGRRPLGVLLRAFDQAEEMKQVLGRGRDRELTHGPRLGIEAGCGSALQGGTDHLDRRERGGIATAGRARRLLARLVENEPTPERPLDQQAFQPSWRPSAWALAADLAAGEGPYVVQKAGGREERVREADAERLTAGDRLAGEDDVEGRDQAHPARQADAAAPSGDDPQLDLGQADAQVLAVGDDDEGRSQRELRAAAEAGAGDRRDGGEGETFPGREKSVSVARARLCQLGIADAGDLRDVGAGNEHPRLG
jgi:hypothetical protein